MDKSRNQAYASKANVRRQLEDSSQCRWERVEGEVDENLLMSFTIIIFPSHSKLTFVCFGFCTRDANDKFIN